MERRELHLWVEREALVELRWLEARKDEGGSGRLPGSQHRCEGRTPKSCLLLLMEILLFETDFRKLQRVQTSSVAAPSDQWQKGLRRTYEALRTSSKRLSKMFAMDAKKSSVQDERRFL